MRRLPALLAALSGALPVLHPAVLAQPAPARPAAEAAVAACERAARQSLATKGAPAAEVRFNGTPAEQAGLSTEHQLVLQGTGTWRGANGPRKFDYSCNVDLRSPEAVGLVLRDTTPAAVDTRPVRPAIEPDLSNLSPAACESATAAALKKRWPRVSEISFDGSTRSLRQDSSSRAELHGQGRALPAPGGPYTHFSFDCELDPRDGRVLGTRISG